MGLAFEILKERRDNIERQVKEASERLNAIPGIGSGPMGLTPDSVKQSLEYRMANHAYRDAHARLRGINTVLTRGFADELREERRQKREALLAAHAQA